MKKSLKVFVAVLILALLAGCNQAPPTKVPATATPVPATATVVPATVTPVPTSIPMPSGKLLFLDLNLGNNIKMLDLTTSLTKDIPVDSDGGYYICEDLGDLIFNQWMPNPPYAQFLRFTPANSTVAHIIFPDLPFEMTDLSCKTDTQGNTYIAFRHYDNPTGRSTFAVYLLNGVNLSYIRTISLKGDFYISPGYSNTADLSKLIFDSTGFGNFYLYDAATDSSTVLKLNGDHPEFPVFSNDGTQLAYGMFDESNGFCDYKMPVSNPADQKSIFCDRTDKNASPSDRPLWSPDGKTIAIKYLTAYTSEVGYNNGMHLALVDTSNLRIIADIVLPGYGQVAWSPDSQFLAYDADPYHDSGFQIIGLTGKQFGNNYVFDGTLTDVKATQPFGLIVWVK